jgi:protein TonB
MSQLNSLNFATVADRGCFAPVTPPVFSATDGRIVAALVASLLLHGLGLYCLPGLRVSMFEVPQRLQVQLPLPVARAEPVPVSPAYAPAPSTSRRTAVPTVAPIHRASPRESDLRTRETLAMPTRPAAQVPQEIPAVLAPEPDRASADQPARPLAAPISAAADQIDVGVLSAYGRELAGAVAVHQRYPRIALLRHWEGTAVLQLELAADGRLLAVRVLNSSGYETLDRQALEMVREAMPFPPLPVAFGGRQLTLDVPVVFRIAS